MVRNKKALNLYIETALLKPAARYVHDYRKGSISALVNELLDSRLVASGYRKPNKTEAAS